MIFYRIKNCLKIICSQHTLNSHENEESVDNEKHLEFSESQDTENNLSYQNYDPKSCELMLGGFCQIDGCDENFETPTENVQHLLATHHEGDKKCVVCNLVLVSFPKLMVHYYGTHLKIQTFSCRKCEMAFVRKISAERHVLSDRCEKKPTSIKDIVENKVLKKPEYFQNYSAEMKQEQLENEHIQRIDCSYQNCDSVAKKLHQSKENIISKHEFDQDDISLDVRNLSRPELLTQLFQYKNDGSLDNFKKYATESLKESLRVAICVSHPIHKFLTNLPKKQIKIIHSKCYDQSIRKANPRRMPKEVAKYFFQKYPESPLTSLRHFIKKGFENHESFDDTNENFMESNLVENNREISEDPSVDVTNLSRSELLSRLPKKTSNSKQVTEKLRPKLRKYIKDSHPIHKYVDDLLKEDVKLVFSKILFMKQKLKNDPSYRLYLSHKQMKHQITKTFFHIYPQSPLTSLKMFIENGCMDELEAPNETYEEDSNYHTFEVQDNFKEDSFEIPIENNASIDEHYQNNDTTYLNCDFENKNLENQLHYDFHPQIDNIDMPIVQEDYSVDIDNMTRDEILNLLNVPESKQSDRNLKIYCSNRLKKFHPILPFLENLSEPKFKVIQNIVCPISSKVCKSSCSEIAKVFFKNYPQSPLASLKYFMENDWAKKLQMIDSEEKISEIEIKTENREQSETKCIEIHYGSSNQESTPESLSEIEEDFRNKETAAIDDITYFDYEMPQPNFENYESFGDTYASDKDFMAGQETDLFENNREMLEIEDPSVDVTNLSRAELLSRLPQNNSNSKEVTEKLRSKLRKCIRDSHPINKYVDNLLKEDVKLIFSKILSMKQKLKNNPSYRLYDYNLSHKQMKHQITMTFFRIYPQSPLTSLEKFIENGCVDELITPQFKIHEEDTIYHAFEVKDQFKGDSFEMAFDNFPIDPSVDVSNWTRTEILSRLPDSMKRNTTKDLQRKMRVLLSKSHPIHKFLKKLSKPKIRFVHSKVVKNRDDCRNYPRLSKQIARAFFENYPNSPLSCLKNFLIQNKDEINLFDSTAKNVCVGEGHLNEVSDVEMDETDHDPNFASFDLAKTEKIVAKNEFDQDDISIDVRNMTRAEILMQLHKSKTEQSSCYFEKWATETLKRTLIKSICVSHPIHKFLENLPKDQIKLIHSKFYDPKIRKANAGRLPKEIAKYFFQKYPEYPLTSLRTFIEQGYPDLDVSNVEAEEYYSDNSDYEENGSHNVNEDFEVKKEVFDQNEFIETEINPVSIQEATESLTSEFDETGSFLSLNQDQPFIIEEIIDPDDLSVDVSSWTRQEVLSKLGKKPSGKKIRSRIDTKNLKRTLRRSICVSHPIHKLLNSLPKSDLKLAYSKVIQMKRRLDKGVKGNSSFVRMKKEIAKSFFLMYPKSPLTSFRHFIEQGFENHESFGETKSNFVENDREMSKTEDPSVDVTNLSRSELLSRLPQKTSNSKQVTEKLRPKLRKYLKDSHPIHKYVDHLLKEDVNLIFSKILSLKQKLKNDPSYRLYLSHKQMKRQITKTFFHIHPQSPLTSLKKFVENGCVDELEMPKSISKDEVNSNNLQQLMLEKEDYYSEEFNETTYSAGYKLCQEPVESEFSVDNSEHLNDIKQEVVDEF